MASEFNPQYVKDKLPGAIEEILKQHCEKLVASCDIIDELAKKTGAPQAIKDAAAFRQAIDTNAEYVKKLCGEEGDQATETGSFWGVVTAAKKVAIAVGGAD